MSRLLAFVCIAVIASAAAGQDKRKPNFTVGKDTTYITGPLDKDGFPDYEAALNERLREGVTPDNNANVLFFKAMGPHPDRSNVPADFFKWLQIPAPPEKGAYFIDREEYVREHLNKNPQAFDDAIERATHRAWTAQDHPEVAAWLKLNDKPLALVVEATKRTHYYYPLISRDANGKPGHLIASLIPGVQMCRQFGTALAARAMLRVGEKKYDDAWQDLLACHRLGRLVGRGGTLIESLVGIAVDSIASRADLGFLDAVKPDGKHAKRCLADLQALPPHSTLADKIHLTERFTFLQTVVMIDRHGPDVLNEIAGGKPSNDVFGKVVLNNVRWDTAMRNANQLFTRMSSAIRLRERTLRRKHLHDIEMEVRELRASIFDTRDLPGKLINAAISADARGKVIGDILTALLIPALMKVQDASERIEQIQNNGHVAFALAAYRADVGRYPKDLAALAPKYLAEAPLDNFSGKALVYRPTDDGYFFYSVGVNGKNEEGRTYDDDPSGDDLPVRMPQPKVRAKE